jgi:anti-sigma B factor antagonist
VSTQPAILVGCTSNVAQIRVEGKGSFQNSSGLKEFSKEMMNRGYREFVVDLKGCPVMDSTFMGTLAGVALRLREFGEGHLSVINLNQRNFDLLRNLGLDQLFQIKTAPPAATAAAGTPVAAGDVQDPQEQARTMLEAHEALIAAEPENITKFKDVLQYLKQDLQRGE